MHGNSLSTWAKIAGSESEVQDRQSLEGLPSFAIPGPYFIVRFRLVPVRLCQAALFPVKGQLDECHVSLHHQKNVTELRRSLGHETLVVDEDSFTSVAMCNDNDNDNDTLRKVQPTSVSGLVSQAWVKLSWPHEKKFVKADGTCTDGKVCPWCWSVSTWLTWFWPVAKWLFWFSCKKKDRDAECWSHQMLVSLKFCILGSWWCSSNNTVTYRDTGKPRQNERTAGNHAMSTHVWS